MDYNVDSDPDPDDDVHFWMAEEDLADLDYFYGGVMGGMGHDFLFDADLDHLEDDDYLDDPWYYSDESEFSESDSDHNKIFVTLQDSHEMRRLNFHKAVNDGRFRLPRLRQTGQQGHSGETYESLHRLLEELEILLKVWNKRTKHPFTAHIAPGSGETKDKESNSEEDAPAKFGVDYEEHDIEHESDGEADDGAVGGAAGLPYGSYGSSWGGSAMPNAGQSNLPLTKKKFCQSTRTFHEIFSAEGDFGAFLSYVHRVKKEVHSVLFSLFLSQLSDEARLKLPTELWEKIWRLTQTPYRENYYETYSVGFRHDTLEECTDEWRIKNLLVERERVAELFGAVGNLHMMVFEILYKHSYITAIPLMTEVDSLDVKDEDKSGGGRARMSYAKSLFGRFESMLRQAHDRFTALTMDDDEEEDDETSPTAVDRIRQGSFSLSRTHVPVFGPKDGTQSSLKLLMRESQFFVTSSVSSDVVALLDYEVRDDKQPYLRVVLWHAKEERIVAEVNTGCTLLDVCCGRNRNSTNQLFALTSDRFAFITRNQDKESDTYALYQWTFTDGAAEQCPVLRGTLATQAVDSDDGSGSSIFSDRTIVSLKATTLPKFGGPVWLLHHQNPYQAVSRLILIRAAGSGGPAEEIASYEFEGRHLTLDGVKGARAILKDSKGFIFIDLNTGKTLASYDNESLCKDADHKHVTTSPDCVYECKMDLNGERKEFVIFSQNMTGYQLFSYGEGADLTPEVIASGSSLVHNMPFRMLGKTVLMDGVVYAAPSKVVTLRSHVGDFFRDDEDVSELEVFAFDLRASAVVPLVSLLKASSGSDPVQEVVLMNDHSTRFHTDILAHQYPYFVDDHTLLLPMLESYIKVSLHASHRPAIEVDANQLYDAYQALCRKRALEEERRRLEAERQAKKREKERAKEAEKNRKVKEARDKYIGTGEIISGKVKRWTHSYGFIKPLQPTDVKVLGDIFVHISSFCDRGKRFIRVGQKVEFKLEEEEEGRGVGAVKQASERRFRATNVIMKNDKN